MSNRNAWNWLVANARYRTGCPQQFEPDGYYSEESESDEPEDESDDESPVISTISQSDHDTGELFSATEDFGKETK